MMNQEEPQQQQRQHRRRRTKTSMMTTCSNRRKTHAVGVISTPSLSISMTLLVVVVVAGMLQVAHVQAMSPEEYMNRRSNNSPTKEERLENAIDLEKQYEVAIVKAAEEEEAAKLRAKEEAEHVANLENGVVPLLMPTRKTNRHRHENNEVRVHQRIEGLTPYEDQSEITWQEVLDKFPNSFIANMEPTVQMAQKAVLGAFSSSGSEDYQVPTPPYLSVGYAKEGSTSLNLFFNCLGHKSCHYFSHRPGETMASCFEAARLSGQPLLRSCGYPYDCDAYAQMEATYVGLVPQLEHLEQMVLEEPSATLLYPVRNFTSWMISQSKWTANHDVPDMIRLRDANCPFVGLEAFDTNSYIYGAARNKESFLERQQVQQHQFLKMLNDPNISEETRTIFAELDKLRGVDDNARLALFRVYHTTYIREFAFQHNVPLIEFALEDERTGDLLNTIFKAPPNGRCWRQQNSTPQGSTSDKAV